MCGQVFHEQNLDCGKQSHNRDAIESPDQNDGVEYLFSSFPRLGSYWESSENGSYENIAIKFTTGIATSCTLMDLNNDGIINVIDIIKQSSD